jgi:hypothetical protein
VEVPLSGGDCGVQPNGDQAIRVGEGEIPGICRTLQVAVRLYDEAVDRRRPVDRRERGQLRSVALSHFDRAEGSTRLAAENPIEPSVIPACDGEQMSRRLRGAPFAARRHFPLGLCKPIGRPGNRVDTGPIPGSDRFGTG